MMIAVLAAAPATADLVTVTFTADNIVNDSGLCNDSSCLNGYEWSYFGPVPNRDDWRQSDTVVIDLDLEHTVDL